MNALMTYSLIQLTPGAYDLLLKGEIIGSVVRAVHRRNSTVWAAELLEELPPSKRPAPFKDVEHQFQALEELCVWLGSPEVESNFGESVLVR
jgi:phosphatidylserine/phosphatidylglycerophosphate/cardiolipin synthase-like enzyme